MNDVKKPLVSVIVPSYNHSKYIKECIEGIVNQTYTNWELIVIDDGSRDNSNEILKDLSQEYGFKFVKQENRGVSATLNRGIEEFSSGKYFTFCASDDFWTKDKLEKQVQFMEKNSDIPMCYGKTHYVDENSEVINELDKKNKNLIGGKLFEKIFMLELHPPVNYLFKKSIFNEVGNYDEKLFAEDFDMNLRISSRYQIGFINEYLSYYRINNLSFKLYNYEKLTNSHLKSINKFKDHKLYRKALQKCKLNLFYAISGYSKKKIESIKLIPSILTKTVDLKFIKGMVNLIFRWKKLNAKKN